MAKTYQISNNIIFCVNEDGSITKFATIDENGMIVRLGEKANYHKNRRIWLYRGAIMLFIGLAIAFFCMFQNSESNYRYEYSQKHNYEQKYKKSLSEITTLKSEKQKLADAKQSVEVALSNLKGKIGMTYPLIISDIEIANVTYDGDIETNYGNTIYSSNTMYLKPRIKYYGISSGYKNLKVKWYNPNGTIKTGTSSPYGFSQSEDCFIYSGSDNTCSLNGWGNRNKGHWTSGTYRIEVWYENTCLKSKTFTIY